MPRASPLPPGAARVRVRETLPPNRPLFGVFKEKKTKQNKQNKQKKPQNKQQQKTNKKGKQPTKGGLGKGGMSWWVPPHPLPRAPGRLLRRGGGERGGGARCPELPEPAAAAVYPVREGREALSSREGAKCEVNNRKTAFNYGLGLIVKLRLQNLFMFHGLPVL